MVGQPDTQRRQRLLYPLGHQHVGIGGQRHAAGVVMSQNDGAGPGVQGVLHHLPHMDGGGGHRPLGDAPAGQQLALAVQTHLIQKLPLLPRQQLHEVRAGAVRRVEDLLRQAGDPRPLADIRHQMQQQGGVLAHTLHLLQFLRRCLQDAL